MSGGNADCVLALPEDYTTKYGFQFSQFSPIAEVEEEEPSVNDKNQDEQSLIVKKKQLLLSHQKANLYIPLSKSQTPPVKHPKPTAKQREANRQQQQQRHQQQQNQQQQQQQQQQSQQPLSPKSQKSPLSPVRSPPATRPVQPVFPLPDRRPGEEGASPPVQDAAVHMQHYKVHQSSRSPNSGSPNGRAHMLISSPSSSVEHSPNSDNNSGTSTPMYSERSSPSGSSCNTSTGVHNKSYVRPSIAVMQHSYTADPSKRGTDITKVYSFTEPMDGINLSQCSNSSRDSNSSSRSKREIRSPESQKPKFPSPEGQYSMDGQFRSTDMPTAVVRHHATGVHKQRQNRDEQDMYTRLHPKGLSGYISDGGMSVTSSIEELSAINQTSDYTDLSTQPNVVIVKPQPVAGTAYYHQTGFKDHMQSTNDHKQQSRGGIPPPNQGVISPPNSKQGNSSYSYHTQPQFSTKGFPPSHHGQFKQSYPPTQTVSASPHWATQRQGPPSNNYSKQGKPIEYIKTASPPGVKEGKARSYLVADGTDYSNEMIAAYRAHEAAVNGDFMYLYRVVSSGEIPPTLADHHKSTLIHKSALNGHLKCLSFLVKNSHPDAINLLDDNLLTPVLLSIQGGHLDCVRWLVDETNVEMVVPDAGGETLLHHAAFHGKVNILEWLIEKIKSRGEQLPDIVDDSGVTPAHFAAQQGHLDCLQLLYDKGCSLTFADHDNQRPMDWADASNQMLCSHYLLIVETCWQLSNDVAMLKQQLMKVQTENQSLKDIIGGMEKEHNKNMSKIQLQYEAKIEKIRENYVDLTAKLIQDVKENQQGTGKLPTSRTMSDSTNAHYHFQQADVDKAKAPKDTDYDANISGLAQEVLRKRQSTVAQRMLENREVRRRQPVLAGRASPLSPSLHRMEQFNTENEMTKSHQPHQKKAGGRVVTFAPHVEEFPKSPSPNYTVDHALHTLTEEPPIQPDQRYHENTD